MKPLYVKKNGTVNKVSGVAMPNTYPADRVGYDNTTSELESTNTQDAIDEVVGIVADKVDKVAGKGLSTNDYDNTDKAKVGKIDETTTSISGNPISISGLKSNQLAINPVITLEPIQAGSGDPSPSNVRAISGYDKIEVLSCGKGENQLNYNAWKDVTVLRGTAVFENNGVTLTATGDDCLTGFYYPDQWGQGFPEDAVVSVNEGDVVLLTWEENTNANGYVMIFGNGYTNSMVTIDNHDAKALSYVVPSGITYVTFRFGVANSGVSISYKNIHISVQKPNTNIQLTLGQTIYGGTLDVEKGILTVDKAIETYDGSEDEAWDGSEFIHGIAISSNYQKSQIVIANAFKGISPRVYSSLNTGEIALNTAYTGINAKYTISGLSDWKTYLASNNLQVVYELATPYTIQLTPHEISLLKDYTYVSTNGTNISLDYHNGEIASLGDVAQLGQTVNLLEDKTLTYTRYGADTEVIIDLNTLVNNGTYSVYIRDKTTQHAPNTGHYVVTVTRIDDNPQYVIQHISHNDTYMNSYMRRSYGGTWEDWCCLTPYASVVTLNSCDSLDKIFSTMKNAFGFRLYAAASPVQGYGLIGGGVSNALQTLIGNPNIGTNVYASFRLVNDCLIEVFATNYSTGNRYNLKRKYIWNTGQQYMQSAWEDIVSV